MEEFLRLLDASIADALDNGHLRRPTEADPLRIVDLGCGNAYLTFAAQRFLVDVRTEAGRLFLEMAFPEPANPVAVRSLLRGFDCPARL